MQYLGNSFIFNNVPSQRYGLCIVSIGSPDDSYEGGSQLELVTDQVVGSPRLTLLGVKKETPLSFSMEIAREEPIDLYTSRAIKNWLLDQSDYHELKIQNDETRGIFYNCIITACEEIIIDERHGYRLEVQCDAPWGWTEEKTLKKNNVISETSFVFINDTDDNNGSFPTLITTSAGQDIVIQNETTGESIKIINAPEKMEITIDCESQIITTRIWDESTSSYKDNTSPAFDYFDTNSGGYFIRLAKGVNKISISPCASFVMKYRFARKVGG